MPNWSADASSSDRYRQAIDLTIKTIELRSRYFRNLLVMVVSTVATSAILTVITGSVAPIAILFFLFPFFQFFLYRDQHVLNHWRSRLLQSWVRRTFDVQAFRHAITAMPGLPKETLEGMLETLPSAGDIRAEREASLNTRQAVEAAVSTLGLCRSAAAGFLTVHYIIIAASFSAAAAFYTWRPLVGGFAVLLLWSIRYGVIRMRLNAGRRRILAAQRQPDFNERHCAVLIDGIKWRERPDSALAYLLPFTRL